ncbi:MAG TPA: polysaccharide biosynthesis/export family protein [Planctomycetota bacterium]|jgi:protein involved in polysaccharide export with SLBB domain|nr:polysaccharide biosynthesis/export family protein [Planctomycetota bacterium]
MGPRLFVAMLGGILAATLLAGCASPRQVVDPMAVDLAVQAAPVEPPRYEIQPGDQLEIRFFHTPELNVTLPVRPDGDISLPLANDVRAAGRTCEELRAELVRRFDRELADPEIAVIVRSFTAYKVHVGGHVAKPGVFELSGARTVLQALFEAGGELPTASLKDVLVIRRARSGPYRVIPVDLTRAISGEDMTQNLPLQPYDAIYVAASPIADVNKWVDQYLRQNIPFSVSYRINFGR